MLTSATLKTLVLSIVSAISATGQAVAAVKGPRSANGSRVQVIASGLQTTTAFAFGAGQVFAAEQSQRSGNGLFVIGHGRPRRVADAPSSPFGLAWHKKSLYVSAGSRLYRLSGWSGSRFRHSQVIYRAPHGFVGFNGIGFGADNRLYAGVFLGETNDTPPRHAFPYVYDILSFSSTGGDMRVFARGIREPWQLAFPAGSSSPFVSDFGQDFNAANPPDFLLRVQQRDDYGFPYCNWTHPSRCSQYARPYRFFPAHTNVGGLAIARGNLLISEFGFDAKHHPPLVVSMPIGGGRLRTVLSGFRYPIIGLAANRGWVYVGDVAGYVYRSKL